MQINKIIHLQWYWCSQKIVKVAILSGNNGKREDLKDSDTSNVEHIPYVEPKTPTFPKIVSLQKVSKLKILARAAVA